MGGYARWKQHISEALSFFDPERRNLARKYRRLRYLGLSASLVVRAGVTLWLGLYGGSRVLERLILSVLSVPNLTAGPAPGNPVFALWASLTATAYWIAALPVSYIAGYLWPKRYGIVHHSCGQWIRDKATSFGVTLAVVLPGSLGFAWLLHRYASLWWAPASLLAFAFVVFVTFAAPVLLMPLYNRFAPMEAGPLRDALIDMAGRAGTRVNGVFVMDMSRRTSAANAMLAGLSKTRRMILADTLLKGFPEDEIKVVMAHELAHHRLGHIPMSLLLSAFGIPLSFLVADRAARALAAFAGTPGEALSVPVFSGLLLVALWAIDLVTAPLNTAISRHYERQSDRFALQLTGTPGAFARMMARLADGALADTHPPAIVQFFFYTHPPAVERIARALAEREVLS